MTTVRSPDRRAVARWALVCAALAVALGVALWPRGERASPPQDEALAAGRAAAALEPCPAAEPGARPAGGRLAGLQRPCLGAPGTVDVGAALAGRPVLLNVWASW